MGNGRLRLLTTMGEQEQEVDIMHETLIDPVEKGILRQARLVAMSCVLPVFIVF